MKARFNRCIEIAKDIHTNYCKDKNYPIDFEKLVTDLDKNISIEYTDLYGEDGFVCYNKFKNKYRIFIDTNFNIGRINFTIAHELGHVFLNHLVDYNICKLESSIHMDGYDELLAVLDKEADCFAGELLMPKYVLVSGRGFFDLLQYINVSHEALSVRCKILKLSLKDKQLNAIEEDDLEDYFKDEYSDKGLTDKQLNAIEEFDFDGYFNNEFLMNKQEDTITSISLSSLDIEIKLDKNSKAVVCPVCKNKELHFGNFCIICGAYLINECVECSELLVGSSRHCHKCGEPSSFLINNILPKWNKVFK